jgi:hypothetical protein
VTANPKTRIIVLAFPGVASRIENRQSQLCHQDLHDHVSSGPAPDFGI